MKTGIELIAEQRARQISQEGWTADHDDEHKDGEMSGAAACYAIAANELSARTPYLNSPNRSLWAWEMFWWKPGKCAIRCLVKAGALIAAEIDRLQRLNDPSAGTAD
jgi:hypothetical protein